MKPIIFDNGGVTFDRYTIILKDGETFGASHNPFSPQGFGQYCGNAVELVFKTVANAYYDTKKGRYFPDMVKLAISSLKRDYKERGEEIVEVSGLPEQVQNYIKQISKT